VLQVVWFAYAAWGLVIAMVLEYTVRGSLRPLSQISPADCLLVFVRELDLATVFSTEPYSSSHSQPLMLGGTTGSALAAFMPGSQATYVIVISYMLQGMGWFLSLMK
jgi:hypothetical protein